MESFTMSACKDTLTGQMGSINLIADKSALLFTYKPHYRMRVRA